MPKHLLRGALTLCLAILTIQPTMGSADKPINVTFINPDPSAPYWIESQNLITQAAQSLNIKLTVVGAKSRFDYLKIAQEVVSTKPLSDYMLFIYQKNLGKKLFSFYEKQEIPFFTMNTEIVDEDALTIGTPGEKFKYWIGQSKPLSQDLGKKLAVGLINQVRSSLGTEDVNLIGISGSHDSANASKLNSGLDQALTKDLKTTLKQLVFSMWDENIAREQVKGLLLRYPKTNGIWVVGEDSTLGAIKGAKEAGRKPGVDIFIAGTAASKRGIEAIEQGEISALMGDDLWEGAWALVRIYDYHHNKSEKGSKQVFTFTSDFVNQENVAKYKALIIDQRYKDIDFSVFSKTLNPKAENHEMTIDSLLRSAKKSSE